jgi:hypothetical protein
MSIYSKDFLSRRFNHAYFYHFFSIAEISKSGVSVSRWK